MKMTSTFMFTLVAILAGCTVIQANTVNCLVAPCSTDACIKKCADVQTKTHKSVTCVDNYNDGCNCDCKVNSGSYTNGTVNCFVAPCTTPECISKCAAFQTYNKNVTCVDNYIGGCNCACCVAKNAICSVDRKDPPCCGGRICAFTNDCIVNPFTKCGTICVKPADAVENCKKEKCSCDLSKKTPCCKGLTCLKYGSEGRCSKCRGYTKSCSSSRPCCPYLKCKKDSYTGKKTCQPAGLP